MDRLMEFINIFIIGILYGFTTCSLTCLPYLAPYMMGVGGGFRDGMKSSVFFVFGKVVTYGGLSGAAAWMGRGHIKGNEGFLKYAIGIPLIVIGLMLLLRKEKMGCSNGPFAWVVHRSSNKRLHLFIMGTLTSIVPCAPLSALLLMAVKSGSVVIGMLYGLLYGSGLILSPLILAGGFFSFISERIRTEVPDMIRMMRTASAIVIIFMGILTIDFLSAKQSDQKHRVIHSDTKGGDLMQKTKRE